MLNIKVECDGDPQKKGSSWFATDLSTGNKFLVGYTVPYSGGDGKHRGITQTKVLNGLPDLYYDRFQQELKFGSWAHFIWPTVVAESAGGHHLLVNTYDRARFTFGFYQLAAHTPNDNLILLFRKLLTLESAAKYFPDLVLKSNKVHLKGKNDNLTSLETVTSVTRPNGRVEDQIVGFMTYLNPDTQKVGEIEVLNTAKLMHWLMSDTEAVSLSVATALEIMKRKLKRAASTFGLVGKRPELAIWVSDILHQGRGGNAAIRNALSEADFNRQMQALYHIGSQNSQFAGRRKTVRDCIKKLVNEGRFDGKWLGQGELTL
ncbi:hypothetical protein FJU08_20745 [Martelella alba]|uniref:Uncharacterized protein n=1 Tax=Martelella alba TaxID=2590451 RepID=A0A506U3U3_9HYPH|nr:hypothetical protein [Martelella alba]TPW27219.1 hypothetical protein FJU08_20745 [Martelella alba]